MAKPSPVLATVAAVFPTREGADDRADDRNRHPHERPGQATEQRAPAGPGRTAVFLGIAGGGGKLENLGEGGETGGEHQPEPWQPERHQQQPRQLGPDQER